jgi:hypothetical protein
MPPGTLNNVSTFEDLLPMNDVVWVDVEEAEDVRCFFWVFVVVVVVVELVVEVEVEVEVEEKAAAVGARLFCFCFCFCFCIAGGSATGSAKDTVSNRTLMGREQVVNVWTTCATDAILMPLTKDKQAPTGTLALLSSVQT